MRPLVIAALALSAATGPLAAADTAARKPNVLVIVADDLGYADLGAHGGTACPTPHIDSIAADGAKFTSGYVPCPYCSPTRAALLTGKYQTRFGHEFNPALLRHGGKGQGLPPDEKTVADRLKLVGYRTGAVGKWHQGEEPEFHPNARGFDEFFGFLTGAHDYNVGDDPNFGPIYRNKDKVELKGYLTDVLADEAVGFIDRNKDKPWFLYLAFNAVHTPNQAPEADLAKFADVKDEKRRSYLAMLSRMDDGVGKVLAKLKDAKLDPETLVFFISDNGGPTNKFSPNGSVNDPLRGSKGDTWEGGVRVPFFVRWKGIVLPKQEVEHPVIGMDIPATALAVAEVGLKDDEKPLDGVNLLPHLNGSKKAAPHPALFWRFGPQSAVRMGDWKLVTASQSDAHYVDTPKAPMLFNLREDASEKVDLAAEFPDRVKEMQAAWDKWNEGNVAPKWPATLKGKPLDLKQP